MLDGAKVAEMLQAEMFCGVFDESPRGPFPDNTLPVADGVQRQAGFTAKRYDGTPAPGYRVEEWPDLAGFDQVNVAMPRCAQ
jgi:hypothetical protein